MNAAIEYFPGAVLSASLQKYRLQAATEPRVHGSNGLGLLRNCPQGEKTLMTATDWNKECRRLIKKYKGQKHPLDYQNIYQLLVMVVLSAQDSDRNINQLAPALFKAFPTMNTLAKADAASLITYIGKVRGSAKKTKWLLEIAAKIKRDKDIPSSMEELTALPGIGRKSANVILREMGKKAEGIMVDLHVVRVAPRLGVATGSDPKKIEQQMMDVLDPKIWGEVGMAMSFLGREICRPSNPQHDQCVLKDVCAYCKSSK